jgi:polysaccharide export outer membrane protein
MPAFKPAAPILAAFSALPVLWLATPSQAQSQAQPQAQASASAPPAASPAAGSVAPASAAPLGRTPAPPVSRNDYRIGLYDVLDINVFEIDDLHRQVQVDGSGRIVLPLIGDVQAQGRTPFELAEVLRQKLDARYVNNAKVEVQVRQSQSEHVTVDGAVTEPGVFPLKGPTTLLQAVAMAKGPDGPNANVHKVSLFRSSGGNWTRTQYDLAKIRNGKIEDPEIEPRDVVVVAGSKKQDILRTLGTVLPVALLAAAL